MTRDGDGDGDGDGEGKQKLKCNVQITNRLVTCIDSL